MSDDNLETHNVFAERTVEESQELHPSNSDHVSVLHTDVDPEPDAMKRLTAEDCAKIAAAFDNLSKAYMQAFLYLEKCCQDGAQLALDMAEYLKDEENPNNEGTDTDG